MTRFHTVALADVAAVPWRNGGGITHPLLTWPVQAAGDDWTLRVSVARIDRSGPFSAFAGIERWFTVLEGSGVRLELPRGQRSVVPGDEPLHFDGDDAPMCELLEGPTLDLNLMLRRGAGRGRATSARAGSAVEGHTRWRGLYAATPVLLDIDGVAETVGAHTLAWSDALDAAPWSLHTRSHGTAWWLTLED